VKSLLFVSLPVLPPEILPVELKRIEAVSRRRNAQAAVTGALICTEWQFAGVLEGEGEAVEGVMARIRDDSRHHKVVVAEERTIARRVFRNWSLAYSGGSMFARKLVSPLFSDPCETSAGKLRLFITEMAR
jgi:hypothetical protein